MSKYTQCPNAMNGKHKWRDNLAKHKGKPKCCVYCSRLAVDLIAAEKEDET
jgi:hypothetical protein